MKRLALFLALFSFSALLPHNTVAQSATASLRGVVTDATHAVVPGAEVILTSKDTAQQRSQRSDSNGEFSFQELFIGDYHVEVRTTGFATWVNSSVRLDVGNQSQISVQLVAASTDQTIEVTSAAAGLQTNEIAQGAVVTEREIASLPLNGRNFAQLGILQPGVRPVSSTLVVQGGFRRIGQNYEVNGQRPESNNFLVDGMRDINRMDAGYAFRPPADSIAEFRILTATAPAEFGGTSGGITTIVTRSGTNTLHGTLYEFFRNDALDANNYFAPTKEALRQNQYGVTAGGPIVHDHAYLFAYYEGLRTAQDITHGVVVPTVAERNGDFSADTPILLNSTHAAPAFGNSLAGQISPITARYLAFFPVPNTPQDPHLAQTTNLSRYNSDLGGAKADWLIGNKDVLSARYSYSTLFNRDPYSELGADGPGFPEGNYTNTHLGGLTETHTFSTRTALTANASIFQNHILLDKRFSGFSPQTFGFTYASTRAEATGAPLIMTQGFSNVGDPIINPRDSVQNDYAFSTNVSHTQGKHVTSVGAQYRRTLINGYQANFASGTFSFTVQGYTNNSLANFLLGKPDIFTQAGGDFTRDIRGWELGAYAQDEFRLSSRLTLNYGVRYEITTPFKDIHNRMMAFDPGHQSTVYPNAPNGLLFPGDAGVPDTITPTFKSDWAPRVGFSWDPRGNSRTVVRSAYGIFYDALLNGVGMPFRATTSALPQTVVRTLTGTINYVNPLSTVTNPFTPGQFALPASTFTLDRHILPPYTQDWNLSVDQSFAGQVLSVAYIGAKGTRLPRLVEGNPAIYQPGATLANSGRRRLYSGCTLTTGTCKLGTAGLVVGNANSTFHSAQVSLTRRSAADLNYTLSYTLSKDLGYSSSLHLSGPAPMLIDGELDVPQNNQNLKGEYGRSIFDSRHRFVASVTYAVPFARSFTGVSRVLLDGWQFNSLLAINSGTPFTVYDSANVSLQAPHPGVSGMFGDRPNVVSNPNKNAPHKVSQWANTSAFQRLDPIADAGQFGNEQRNSNDGPAYGSLDAALSKTFSVSEKNRLQFRAEAFNVTNRVNFILPVDDINSPVFNQIIEAQSPRIFQFALKLQR